MSAEHKRNGALRLRCDGDGCDRKFVPLRPYTDAQQLRNRAELYGWSVAATRSAQTSIPGTTSTRNRDLCPECVRGAA